MQSVCEHCVQSRVCSACSRRIEWDLACVSQKGRTERDGEGGGGEGERVEKGWGGVEDRRGRLHVQKRVLAHLASCHLGLAPKRGGSNTLAFYSHALANGCGKDGGFLSLRPTRFFCKYIKREPPSHRPVEVYFLKCWHSLIRFSSRFPKKRKKKNDRILGKYETSDPVNSFITTWISFTKIVCCYVKQLNGISCVENNASSANRHSITFDTRSVHWKISPDIDRTLNVLFVTRAILDKQPVS